MESETNPPPGEWFNKRLGFFRRFKVINHLLKTSTMNQSTEPIRGNQWLNNSAINSSLLQYGQNYSDSVTRETTLTLGNTSLAINCTNMTECSVNSTSAATAHGRLPPAALPDTDQALIIGFYTLAIVLAVTGNLLSIIIFSTGRRSRGDLRTYLINLALADLSMGIFCMPFTFPTIIYNHWQFGEHMCTTMMFLQTVTVTVSVLTNMLIGVDRFLAVKFPMKRLVKDTKRKIIAIIVIWIVSIGISSPNLVVGKVTEIPTNPGYYVCDEVWSNNEQKIAYGLSILVSTYIIPLTILMVTYGIVAAELWTRHTPGEAHKARDEAQLQSKKKIIKMLVVICALFGFCWLPLHTFLNVLDFNPEIYETTDHKTLATIYIIFHWLAMSNSFQNPIIYGFLNDNFRADFRDLILFCFPCCSSLRYFKHHRRMSYTKGHTRWNSNAFHDRRENWHSQSARSTRVSSSSSSDEKPEHKRFGKMNGHFLRAKTETELLTVRRMHSMPPLASRPIDKKQPKTLIVPSPRLPADRKMAEMEKLLEKPSDSTENKTKKQCK